MGGEFVVSDKRPDLNRVGWISARATASAELKWLNGVSVAGTFEGEFSNVVSSYAGNGVIRYAW